MKNKKLARFLITQNDFARPGEVYVVHTREPAFIAQILQFDNNEAGRAFLETAQPAYAIHLKRVPIVIEVVRIFDEPTDAIMDVLKQLGKWYIFTRPGSGGTVPVDAPAD